MTVAFALNVLRYDPDSRSNSSNSSIRLLGGLRFAKATVCLAIWLALFGPVACAAGDFRPAIIFSFATATDKSSKFTPPREGYLRLTSRFTTHVTPSSKTDPYGCTRLYDLASSLDAEDLTEFLAVGLATLQEDMKVSVGTWSGTESVANIPIALKLISEHKRVPESILSDESGYPTVLISSVVNPMSAITRAATPDLAEALSLRSARQGKAEGFIQYQLRLRPPYLWHEVALDLRFFQGPGSLPLSDVTEPAKIDQVKLNQWAEALAFKINKQYGDVLSKIKLKRLGDVSLAPDQARLEKFGEVAGQRWTALLASRCTNILTEQ